MPFLIRQNLWEFLNILRARHDSCILWVDAICIDQENVLERNQQVSLMAQIYRTASDVKVWLGLGTSDSDFVLETLHHYGERGNGKYWLVKSYSEREIIRLWTGIVNLFRWEYWTRTWIIQEVILGRECTLHCGERTLPFGSFQPFFFQRF
jgi:hypothetical protein